MPRDLFIYGTLRHPPILRAALGREVHGQPAILADHAVLRAVDGLPLLRPQPGAQAEGMLLQALDETEIARLDFYELGFGYDLVEVDLTLDGASHRAWVYRAGPALEATADLWSLDHWVADHGALTAEAAVDYMALFGRVSAVAARPLWPQIEDRAGARLRARAMVSARGRRQGATATEVKTLFRSRPYVGFFALEEAQLLVPRFDGGLGEAVNRAAFVSGDAVTVLPYDPVRDRVLLVEQFRYGAFVRGDPLPWSLEPVAGRIDGGETPEATARREAQEEAGLALSRLVPIGRYYSSPGGTSEYLFSYIGLADLPDVLPRHGGLEEEQEDLRLHLIDHDDLQTMVTSGEIENAPLLISVLALGRLRDSLRG